MQLPALELKTGRILAIGLGVLILLAFGWAIMRTLLSPAPITRADYEPFGSKQEYEAFYQQHPAVNSRPPEKAMFHFKSSVSANKQLVLQVYLFEPAVKAGKTDTEDYLTLLKKYQQEAKDWFAAQGEDLSKDYVQWYPDPDKIDVQ